MNAALKVIVAVAFVMASAGGGFLVSSAGSDQLGCQPLSHAPAGAFTHNWDGHDETMTVRYASGDTFGTEYATALSVNVTDAETGAVTDVTWKGEFDGEFVPGEETFVITQESVAFDLSANDTAQVVWRGELPDHPGHCHDAGSATRRFVTNQSG